MKLTVSNILSVTNSKLYNGIGIVLIITSAIFAFLNGKDLSLFKITYYFAIIAILIPIPIQISAQIRKYRQYQFEDNTHLLYLYAQTNNIEKCKKLLKGGRLNINYTDNQGVSCLYLACYHNNIELAKLLLKSKVIVDDKTKEEYSNFLLEARL